MAPPLIAKALNFDNCSMEDMMNRLVVSVLFLAVLIAPIDSDAGDVPYYESVVEMFESLGDYERENLTLEILSERPLRIQLTELVFSGDFPEVIQELVKRGIIYGVYRTFVHTDIDLITVSVVPGEVNPSDMKVRRMLEEYRITITSSREHALAHAQKFCRVASLQGLVGNRVYGDLVIPNQWIACFEQLHYNDQGGPGLAKFFPGLGE